MSAQLGIQGHIIELEEEIAYNFQVGNIADFSKLKSNYTSAFKIPKTIDVVRLFEGLGIPSDTSTVPYRINNVDCLDDYSIVYSGTLVVLKTDELYYHSTVISGVYDLATVLGDATLYDVVEDIVPLKSPEAVYSGLLQASPIPPYTRFMMVDFGGVMPINNSNRYDADVFACSIFLDSLIQFIFQHAGYTYSLPASIDLTDEMVALPIPPLVDYAMDSTQRAEANVNDEGDALSSGNTPVAWDSVSFESGFFTYNASTVTFTCVTAGIYRISFDMIALNRYATSTPNWSRARVLILLNGSTIGAFDGLSNDGGMAKYSTVVYMMASSTIRIVVETTLPSSPFSIRIYTAGNMSISSVVNDPKKLGSFLNMKLTDFIKEFAYRYMLTPVQDGNNVAFISLYDTLQNWDVVDWSSKYIERKEETYTLNYAQNNWLRHSYADESADYYDLNLQSNNLNAPVNKDIVKSKIFAPTLDGVYPIYDQEQGSSGNVSKPKTNNRMYWIKRERGPLETDIFIESRTIPILGEYKIDQGVYVNKADTYTAGFNQSERWESLRSIIEDTRVHLIDLNLSIVDVTNIDFSKVYYFEQEASYYILNNLKYTKGKVTTAEFVKVRPKDPVWDDLLISYSNYAEYPLQVSTPYDGTIDIPANWSGNFSIRRKDDEDYIITVTPHRPGGMILDITIDDGDGYHDNFWAEDTPRAIPKTIVEPVYMDFELGS